jgi:hypothetical protein
MPFESAAQRGYLHAHPEILGKKALAEWDAASKGQHVPEHVHKTASYSVARATRKESEKKEG